MPRTTGNDQASNMLAAICDACYAHVTGFRPTVIDECMLAHPHFGLCQISQVNRARTDRCMNCGTQAPLTAITATGDERQRLSEITIERTPMDPANRIPTIEAAAGGRIWWAVRIGGDILTRRTSRAAALADFRAAVLTGRERTPVGITVWNITPPSAETFETHRARLRAGRFPYDTLPYDTLNSAPTGDPAPGQTGRTNITRPEVKSRRRRRPRADGCTCTPRAGRHATFCMWVK